MNTEQFSRNLRRLRLEKNLTQEQLAVILGVSVQSVSRWECGNTLPDVMLLPQIARLYGVTVDDLYRENASAYANYALRLTSVYEATGRTEDFLAAEQEFTRMSAHSLTGDDLRSWGVLYHYMMKRSASLALQKLEQSIAHPDISPELRASAAQQKIALMCDLGRGAEEAARYDRALAEDPSDPMLWVLCAAAHYHCENFPRSLEVAQEGIGRFPEEALLYVYAGDACRELKRYEEAFSYWKQAVALDRDMLAPVYSMAFCHEELGRFDAAYDVWTELTKELDRRGFTIERKYPAEMAENCRRQLS